MENNKLGKIDGNYFIGKFGGGEVGIYSWFVY